MARPDAVTFDVVVFGSINLDLIFALDRLPGPGETMLGSAARMEPGGKGANQAVAAALDGARVAMAGVVGRDTLADGALAGLRAAGVDLARVRRGDDTTGCAAVCTDPAGRNQIAVGAGANRHAQDMQVEDGILQPGTILLMQMETDPGEGAALIARAHARGARIVLNLAPARAMDFAALRVLDLLVVNEHEAAWLAAQLTTAPTADGLHVALGVGVVRTLGADGCEWATADGAGRLPAVPVQVADTTAAGDCFTGVLCAALSRGAGLPDALRRATTAAALCCTRAGSQGSLPHAEETGAALRQWL